MKGKLNRWSIHVTLGLVLAGFGGTGLVAPVQAQAGPPAQASSQGVSSRFRVLVPALEGSRNGDKVADLVRKETCADMARKLGLNAILHKPFSWPELSVMMRRLLAARAAATAAAAVPGRI